MKRCPIWDHECYGGECMSWDEEHDKCKILFMMELGLWNYQSPYKLEDVKY